VQRVRRKPDVSETAAADGDEVFVPSYEIVAGVTKLNGDTSWRAELAIPRANNWSAARAGTINIRGPSRMDKKDAESDGEKMVDAAKEGGMHAARVMQRKLNGEAIYDSKRGGD